MMDYNYQNNRYDPNTGETLNNGLAKGEGDCKQSYTSNPYAENYGDSSFHYSSEPQPQPSNGYAIASLVLGITAVVPFLFSITIITGTLAIVFGAVAKNRGNRSAMATAGIVCGIVGLVVILLSILLLLCVRI